MVCVCESNFLEQLLLDWQARDVFDGKNWGEVKSRLRMLLYRSRSSITRGSWEALLSLFTQRLSEALEKHVERLGILPNDSRLAATPAPAATSARQPGSVSTSGQAPPASNVSHRRSTPWPVKRLWRPKARVQVKWVDDKGEEEWFDATLVHMDGYGTWRVEYDVGEEEDQVPNELIRSPPQVCLD